MKFDSDLTGDKPLFHEVSGVESSILLISQDFAGLWMRNKRVIKAKKNAAFSLPWSAILDLELVPKLFGTVTIRHRKPIRTREILIYRIYSIKHPTSNKRPPFPSPI